MIFIDSSFFISFAIDIDQNHAMASKHFPQKEDEPVTSEDVIKETLTVISQRKGKKFCIDFFEGIQGDISILPVSSERFQEGLKIFLDHQLQKDVSLIDCISAAMCKKRRIKTILTFDRHFRTLGLTVRP
jgi:predicted nucleic acid-binding protein